MSRFLLGYTSILVILLQLTNCQKELEYTIRIINAANCNITGLKLFIDDLSAHYYKYSSKTYVNARYRVIEVLKKLNKVNLHIERCNNEGYDCEDFQNWKIDNFCQLMGAKNQFWSDFADHSKPRFRCPLRKTIYEVQNSSFDISAAMNWYPEMFKYHWKMHGKIMNEHNGIVHCSVVEGRVDQVRVQNRRTSGKRGKT